MQPNTSTRVIVAKTPDEHRYYALCAEWEFNPLARKLIRQEILNHPEWGIEIPAKGRPYMNSRATITAIAVTIPEFEELQGC